MSVVFVGGWATQAGQYPHLASLGRFLVPFCGFEPAELPSLISDGGKLLIGWSTGSHMLLKNCSHLFSLYDQVLLIAPFLSFTDSFPERLVRRMIAGMGKDPAAVVRSFHKNCAEDAQLDFDAAQTPCLVSGLEFLISSEIDRHPVVSVTNLTLIHGQDDKIVRPAAFSPVCDKFPGAAVLTESGGHKISESVLLNIIERL